MADSSQAVATPPAVATAPDEVEFRLGELLPLCLPLFLGGLWGQAFVPFVATIASDLGTSVALVGQVSTMSLITMGIGSIFSGPLADRYGFRLCIVSGLSVGVVAALLFAGAQTYVMLLLAALVGGVGISMIHGVVFGFVASRFTGDSRRRAFSVTQATNTSAGILGAPILTAVAALTIWRGAFVFVAIMLVLALLVVTRRLPDSPSEIDRSISRPSLRAIYAPIFANRLMRRLYLAAVLRAIGFAGPMIYIGAFYENVHGLTLQQIGFALTASGIGIFIGNLAAGGRWLGRWRLESVYVATTAVLGFGWFFIYTVQVPTLAAVAIVGATTFTGGLSFTSHTSLLANASTGGAATTMTFLTSIIGFGIALGVALSGAILSLGGYPSLGIAMPFFTIGAAFVVWTRPHIQEGLID
jgi:predicted MFS family arabinose efflux permease